MNYSRPGSGSMRSEALRRTRELRRRNNETDNPQMKSVERPESDLHEEKQNFEKKADSAKNNCAEKHTRKNNAMAKNPFSALFSDGKADSDKIIIIVLILILAREGADIKLLLALGYILM